MVLSSSSSNRQWPYFNTDLSRLHVKRVDIRVLLQRIWWLCRQNKKCCFFFCEKFALTVEATKGTNFLQKLLLKTCTIVFEWSIPQKAIQRVSEMHTKKIINTPNTVKYLAHSLFVSFLYTQSQCLNETVLRTKRVSALFLLKTNVP